MAQKQKQQQYHQHPGGGGGSGSGHGRPGTGSIYSGPLDRLAGTLTSTSEELSSSYPYPYYHNGTGTASASAELQNPHRHRRRPCSARVLRCCCATALAMLCVVAVVAFVTWMAVRPHKPKFFVDYAALTYVSLPARSNRLSLGLALNVSCRNANEHVSIAYSGGATEATLVFEHVVVARTTAAAVPAFTQAPKNTTVLTPRMRAVATALDNGTANDLRAALAEGAVPVALRITARVRFILGRFKSQRYKMRVSCDDINLSAPPLPSPPPAFRRRMCVVYF